MKHVNKLLLVGVVMLIGISILCPGIPTKILAMQTVTLLGAVSLGLYLLSHLEPLEEQEEAIRALPATAFQAVWLDQLSKEWLRFSKLLAFFTLSYLASNALMVISRPAGAIFGLILGIAAIRLFFLGYKRVQGVSRSIALGK